MQTQDSPLGSAAMVIVLGPSPIPVYKRALMTGVNLYMARALLHERLTGPRTLERSLWAGCFAFAFAPHPTPIMPDHRPFTPLDPGYLHDLNLQLLRSMCFEMAALAYIADEFPLPHIVRLYTQSPGLGNPFSRRAVRLLSSHVAFSLASMRHGQPPLVRYLFDTLRILQGLYWQRALQLQTFSFPQWDRVALCSGVGFLLEAGVGSLGASPSLRRWLAFLILPFLTRAFIFDQLPLSMLFDNWLTLQLRQLLRETGLPSLARLLLSQLPPALPLGLAPKPEDNCAFCLEELGGDSQVVVLPCGHAHHAYQAEMSWTDTNRRCPICNMPVKLSEPWWKRGLWVVANQDDKDRPPWFGILRTVHAVVDKMWLDAWWWVEECDFAPIE